MSASRSRNLDHVYFTPLDISEPISPTARGASGDITTTTIGSNSNPTTTTTGTSINTTTKSINPYISMKKAGLVIAIALGILTVVAAAVTVILVVADRNSEQTAISDTRTGVSSPSSLTTTLSTATTSTSSSTSLSSSATTTLITTATATTVTEQTSPSTSASSCLRSEFTCNNQQCVPSENVCNGVPDCPDGSDEGISCVCSDQQIQCQNGQCIPRSAVCDEKYDCVDLSDEANCPDCSGFRCQSNNVCLWDRMNKRCNRVFDCQDLSDEINCGSVLGYYTCRNDVRIPRGYLCDGLDDCGDNSDEENCTCRAGQEFACPGGGCILANWKCDGHADCPLGTDEQSCGQCDDHQFTCRDYTCVDKTLRCDGKADCWQGSDEDGCVVLDRDDQGLTVMVEGKSWPVCAEGWTDAHSTWICSTFYNSSVTSWSSQKPANPPSNYILLLRSDTVPHLANFKVNAACAPGAVIHITCQQAACGVRQVETLESFIAGGDITPLGKWPWVVSLTYLTKPICAGALIADRWVLTAAHCVMFPVPGDYNFAQTPHYFSITAGTISIFGSNTTMKESTVTSVVNASNPQSHTVRVVNITRHPDSQVMANGGVDWDLALLELESPVRLSPYVQPICLPSPGQVFPASSYCYIAGWGLVSSRQYLKPNRLRDTRMQLWSKSRCRSNIVAGEAYVNTNSTICAGSMFGVPTACQGDSGGPLMCLNPATGHYSLAGIVSRGGQRCGERRPGKPSNRFARVALAVDWIQKIKKDG